MNAYELADKLQETEPYYSTDYKLFDKAATMLRQQADRIAKLESYLEAYKTRVAELELKLFKVTNRIIATRKKLSKLKKASEK